MRISAAAEELGTTASQLRKLEAEGKIKIRRDLRGQRRVLPEDMPRLREVLYPAQPPGGTIPPGRRGRRQPAQLGEGRSS